jgi:hypothetical protein
MLAYNEPHQRVSIETVAPPAASRAMIRIERRTSALDYRSCRVVQWPKALRSQFQVYPTSTVSRKVTRLANEMEELVAIVQHTRLLARYGRIEPVVCVAITIRFLVQDCRVQHKRSDP